MVFKFKFVEQITRAHFYTPFGVVHYARNLALPLGELSPKVTERVLQAFLNGDINLCAHAAKIHINISVGKRRTSNPSAVKNAERSES